MSNIGEEMRALERQIAAVQANAADAGPDPSGDESLAASRPKCEACGDWDDTVARISVTPRTSALLCAACGASPEVLNGIAAEDGLDDVDE